MIKGPPYPLRRYSLKFNFLFIERFHLWQVRVCVENSNPWIADGTHQFLPSCDFFRTNSLTMKVKNIAFIYSAKLHRRKSVHWNYRCCSFVSAIAFVWLRNQGEVFASPLCSLVLHDPRVFRITKYVISGVIWAFGRPRNGTTSNCKIQTWRLLC